MNSKLQLVIDRFEGEFAVCENRKNREMVNIKISKLPIQAKEGDILILKNNKFEIDEQERINIESKIQEKVKNIFEN